LGHDDRLNNRIKIQINYDLNNNTQQKTKKRRQLNARNSSDPFFEIHSNYANGYDTENLVRLVIVLYCEEQNYIEKQAAGIFNLESKHTIFCTCF